jgi:hypothetical protein
MSSLIEVLKVIQERDDLDSRTEAHAVFSTESGEFAAEMAHIAGLGGDAVRRFASEKMLMSEYWMNQWVGADHGDWGKALRKAVREIKAGVPDVPVSEPVVEAELEQALWESGTVKSGRWEFPASKNRSSGEVLYTTKNGEKIASDRIATTFRHR